MTYFQEFDSIEEALDFMGKAEAAGNASLHPVQRMVTYGDYWIRFWIVGENELVLICGYVETLPELAESEAAHYDLTKPEEKAEYEYAMEGIRRRHERGYMFGKAYSIIEPTGEWGDTHLANLWPITKDLFEALREAGWVKERLPQADRYTLLSVYQAWAQWQRELIARQRVADKQS